MKKESKKDFLCIQPVENYQAPLLPQTNKTGDNTVLLKKLPSRWQKNAKIVTCVGLVGTLTLSGCHLEKPRYCEVFVISSCAINEHFCLLFTIY